MPRQGDVASGQELEAVLQARLDLTEAQHAGPGRRQFDGEWDAVQLHADAGQDACIRWSDDERRLGGASPLKEQLGRFVPHDVLKLPVWVAG